MIPTRRRRRNRGSIGPGGDAFSLDVAGSSTVHITPSGGVWKFTPGEPGELTDFRMSLDLAPTNDQVVLGMTGGGSALGVACDPGTVSETNPGPEPVSGGEVTVTVDNRDGGAFTVVASVTFTADSAGAVTDYVFDALTT